MSRVQLALNVADPDGAPWEVYTVLADSDDAGDLTGSPLDRSDDASTVGRSACAVERSGCCA